MSASKECTTLPAMSTSQGSAPLLAMPTSQESAALPASNADSTSTGTTVGKQATLPGIKVGIEDGVTTKQSPAPKRGRRRTRKGHRLDLRSMLPRTADEAQ